MALTTYMVNQILEARFTDPPSGQYVGLHISDPTNAGLANTELTTISAPNYTRQEVFWSEPINRGVTNANVLTWLALPVISIGYLGIWNAPTGGNLLAVLQCYESFDVTTAGGAIRIPVDGIAVVMGGSPGGRVVPDGGLFEEI
jgi:hypothetical protein